MIAVHAPLAHHHSWFGSLGNASKRGTFLGFGLFDTLLSLALVIILTAGTYALFGPTSTASAVSQENTRLNAMVPGIDASYVSGVDYAGLAQSPFVVAGFQSNTSVWQQPFSVLPDQIATPADSWVAMYQGVAADVCAQLGVDQLNTQQWYEVQVDGQAVVDGNALRLACMKPTNDADLHSLAFVRYTGVRPNGTSGLAPLCFDKTREQVAAGHADTGCSNNPLDYRPATLSGHGG